jgi:pantetheine-phosphate adenylyltransferase
MRVIAGSAKGTALHGATGRNLRPVLDRVKESMFGFLGDRVEGARVLDLFAGTGSLGIEALSRGADHADFIEQHAATARAIKDNLERTHLAEEGRVIAARLPRGLAAADGRYGLIFADPPFRIDTRLLEGLFRLILDRGLLEEDGLLVYRHSPHARYEPPAEEWSLDERRDYGDSVVSVYSVAPNEGRAEETSLNVAMCPGTFDPVTYGHLDVIMRVSRHFEKVYVAVAANPSKCPLFTIEERMAMLNESLSSVDNVEVIAFDSLLVDVAHSVGSCCIIKGLRAMSDFEFEFQMVQFNRQMDEEIETFFVMASPEYTYLSSSGLKEVASYGGTIEGLVPSSVEDRLFEKLGRSKPKRSPKKE